MLVRFTKNAPASRADTLTCVRPDASTTWHEMPRQGILPHDAIHFVVEKTLSWHDAFFGWVAAGSSLTDATARLHGRHGVWSKMTQALQSESLVETFQTEQSGGVSDPASFAAKLVTNCRRNAVPPPDLTAEEIDHVRVALREFGAVWRPLAPGTFFERTFG